MAPIADGRARADARPSQEELVLARRQLAAQGDMLLAPRRRTVPAADAPGGGRDYIDDAVARQRQVIALLAAWLDDLNRLDGTSALHDQLVVALECARRTRDSIEALPAPAPGRRTV